MIQINSSVHGKYKLLELQGRIDGLSAPDAEREFDIHISNGERILFADFSGVAYISSAGLRIFISTQKKLKKIGGEIVILAPSESVLEVFRVSGFNSIFRIIPDKKALDEIFNDIPVDELVTSETGGIKYEHIKSNALAGQLFIIGSQHKLDSSEYAEKDIQPVVSGKIQFGAGLAALGNSYEDYKNLFGESVIINRNFYSYPAVKKSSVDFMLHNDFQSDVNYNFLHGFGYNGEFSAVMKFEKPDGLVCLTEVLAAAADLAKSNIYGIVLLCESGGIWGMNLKQIPVSGNKPKDGNIFDQKNFGDWMDFPLEGGYAHNIIAAAGIAVKDKSKLSEQTREIFSGESDFHIHMGIFEKGSINKNLHEFQQELNRVLTELDIIKVQHILGKSKFKNGVAAIIELEK